MHTISEIEAQIEALQKQSTEVYASVWKGGSSPDPDALARFKDLKGQVELLEASLKKLRARANEERLAAKAARIRELAQNLGLGELQARLAIAKRQIRSFSDAASARVEVVCQHTSLRKAQADNEARYLRSKEAQADNEADDLWEAIRIATPRPERTTSPFGRGFGSSHSHSGRGCTLDQLQNGNWRNMED